ncbi:MAG TPA: hypothetical protein VK663_07220, partial [Burkholderiales bacterium]|nr:hypothetical protein [Burkholderiales bacterium]
YASPHIIEISLKNTGLRRLFQVIFCFGILRLRGHRTGIRAELNSPRHGKIYAQKKTPPGKTPAE